MGFTTGFLSGTALTLGITYLSLQAHRQTRLAQASSLRQQALVLNNIVDPEPATSAAARTLPRAALAHEERAGVFETAKDRWNAQLASEVRRLQETDWNAVRARVEENAGAIWDRVRDSLAGAGQGEAQETGKGKS